MMEVYENCLGNVMPLRKEEQGQKFLHDLWDSSIITIFYN